MGLWNDKSDSCTRLVFLKPQPVFKNPCWQHSLDLVKGSLLFLKQELCNAKLSGVGCCLAWKSERSSHQGVQEDSWRGSSGRGGSNSLIFQHARLFSASGNLFPGIVGSLFFRGFYSLNIVIPYKLLLNSRELSESI